MKNIPGLTDREISNRLLGSAAPQQGVNQRARAMAARGEIQRRARHDGKIGNFPMGSDAREQLASPVPRRGSDVGSLSEDDVKRSLQVWLEASGWQVSVIWGRGRGIDVEAKRAGERWVIEAKGCGSLNPMRVNYFVSMLGELLQRMNDPNAYYSIALPDMKQFRGLWQRLPELAKSRSRISALFVTESGQVEEVSNVPTRRV